MKFLFTLLLIFPLFALAQSAEQPVHSKKTFIDSVGQYYQQASMPIYLYVASSIDGKPVPLKSESGQEIKIEGHGVHAFKHLNYQTKGYDV